VRAPIAGTVVHLQTALGQAVKAEDPILEIHDPTGALVRGFVSERQLAGVRIGQPARVDFVAGPGWGGEGVVVRSGQEFRGADRTLSVWVQLQQPPPWRLRHNLLASVTLVAAESEPVLSVPCEAVQREGSSAYLFVRQPDGTFERRPVRIGRRDDRVAEIRGGLESKEEVAVQGVAELQATYATVK